MRYFFEDDEKDDKQRNNENAEIIHRDVERRDYFEYINENSGTDITKPFDIEFMTGKKDKSGR